MSLFVAVSTALVDHRFIRYRVDSVAKVESCSATNFSRKQETRDDPRFVCLNRVAEVAGEFNARGSPPSRLYTKDAPTAREIFEHLRETTFATQSGE